MQIKALRGAHGDYGSVRRSQIIDVADNKAQQLVKRGLFVPVQGKEAAKSAPVRPSAADKSRSGGRTGDKRILSSSLGGRAPKTLTSAKSKDAAG